MSYLKQKSYDTFRENTLNHILKKFKKEYKDYFPDQRSVSDQLQDLMIIANCLKMYDAADYIKSKMSKTAMM